MKNTVDTAKKAQPAKTAFAVLAATALAFSLAAVPAFAQGPRAGAGCDSPCMRACAAAASKCLADMGAYAKNACCKAASCEGFVDADADGVCDNFGTHIGRGNGTGQGFVDADGDGVCDNRAGVCAAGACIDADADGVCDNRQDGVGCGYGYGLGHGHGDGAGFGHGRGAW
ncbi:hypothetical protein [uncultured Slackia sp.]|uniref:hypothetical protein n=1 Tax=uncultured Slackia sp. TaxID=665903 RepID=UPI0026DF11C6|nr:hypothetical protein [uncultured Slackia sp.]